MGSEREPAQVAERPGDGRAAEPGRAGEPDDPDRPGAVLTGYRQAYARLRRAEAQASHGGPRRLVEQDLRTALAVAERLQARPLASAVRTLAGQVGVAVERNPVEAARGGDSGTLTPRELSVLALVAGGRTNRQVGTELFISEKTVSVHLSRVMAKLGASSRTEAVTVAYHHGLLAPSGVMAEPDDG